jgi:hypothetical protein
MKCRRCVDCEDREHHWIEAYGEDIEHAEYACKHCEALGVACSHCFGEGDEPDSDDEEECSVCNGEGVVPLVRLN